MFISNTEKNEIKREISELKARINVLESEIVLLKASKPVKPAKARKQVDPAKEEAAKLHRREYARLYAQRKKQEKLKAKFDGLIASAPTVKMTP